MIEGGQPRERRDEQEIARASLVQLQRLWVGAG